MRPLDCRSLPASSAAVAVRMLRHALVGTVLVAMPARAQWAVAQADSLLESGRVAAAETLYYAASSAHPRDPFARAALGRYLAARGALRIGAVLLEEARLFGGDTAGIARSLVPIYGSLGDYRALAMLPASPLSQAERKRVGWLVGHATVLEFPDSAAMLDYRPVADGSGIGVVSVSLGERRVDLVIDPRTSGVVLRGSARTRRGLKVFGDDSSGTIAVIPELRLGDIALSNVPARLESDLPLVRGQQPLSSVGLDVVQRLAPTFDPAARTITFRRTGQVRASTAGTRVPMLLDGSEFRVLLDGRWEPLSSTTAAARLATHRWTLDAKKGAIVVQ
jgi:hypothetical protein